MTVADFLTSYRVHVDERATNGIPPKPLDAAQTSAVVEGLKTPPQGEEAYLLDLLVNRVAPGVSESAKVKSAFLGEVASEAVSVTSISPVDAIGYLGRMKGGANMVPLIAALSNPNEEIAAAAANALKGITLAYDPDFLPIAELHKNGNHFATEVLQSWAHAEWFDRTADVPDEIVRVVFRVEGETNTNDFSPATAATTRDDIPEHARSFLGPKIERMGIGDPLAVLKELREKTGLLPILVNAGPTGTESSRKSAWNSLAYLTGTDVSDIPNKRSGAPLIGEIIAPIFFETAQDSGGLPITMNTANLKMGDVIRIRPKDGVVLDADGNELGRFDLDPATLVFYRVGGALSFYVGRSLTEKSAALLGETVPSHLYPETGEVAPKGQPMTLAQKIIAQAAGLDAVQPGQVCFPRVGLVASQDTTGPMTVSELNDLACSRFPDDVFYFQSTCHTSDAKFDSAKVRATQERLTDAAEQRGGVGLRYGDGVVHSYSNHFNLPQEISVSGDSHGRASPGLGFPAGSGRVAFAAATGSFALNIPQSILVRFKGDISAAKDRGITARDLVHAVPYFARQEGLMTFGENVDGTPNKQKLTHNAFNGSIVEFEGLEGLSLFEVFQHTNATAERMAAAGVANLGLDQTIEHMQGSLAHVNQMIEQGYEAREALERRRDAIAQWLENPHLLRADPGAQYQHTLEIDVDQMMEPLVAVPNTPHWIDPISVHAGSPVDKAFIGSCMTIGADFAMAQRIILVAQQHPNGEGPTHAIEGVVAPSMRAQADEHPEVFAALRASGAEVANSGCNLCMGNQRRISTDLIENPDGTTRKPVLMGPLTRNSAGRTGDNVDQFAASAELTALVFVDGEIPTPQRYSQVMGMVMKPEGTGHGFGHTS